VAKLNPDPNGRQQAVAGILVFRVFCEARDNARHAGVGSNHRTVKSSVESNFREPATELPALVTTESHVHPAYLSPVWRKCV